MDIISVQSPNLTRGRKGYHPEAIVIHVMEGTLSGTDTWFGSGKSQVSAHYGVGVNGEVHQYVQETDTAWHAGRVHFPTWKLIKPAGTGNFINPNLYTIGIEHEGNESSEWTPAMYSADAELVASICQRWNIPLDREHIIGHREIYSLKTCPGTVVSLDNIIALARRYMGVPDPADIVASEGTVVTSVNLNLRRNAPTTRAPLARLALSGTHLDYVCFTDKGENVKGNSRWYKTADGIWFWGGGAVDQKLDDAAKLLSKFARDNKCWWITDFGIDRIWAETRGENVKVAVIDSGLNSAHIDIKGKTNVSYHNVLLNSDNSLDCLDNSDDSHGSACAGMIAAQGPDVVGVAPAVELLIVKACDTGGMLCKDAAKAIDYAVAWGAEIISISYPFYDGDRDFQQLQSSIAKIGDATLVACTGDTGDVGVTYPGSNPKCMAVGGCTMDLRLWKGGTLNDQTCVLAPGDQLLLLDRSGNGTHSDSGTSYSAPFVAGVCALSLSKAKRSGLKLNTDWFKSTFASTSTGKGDVQAQIKHDYEPAPNLPNLGIISPTSITNKIGARGS